MSPYIKRPGRIHHCALPQSKRGMGRSGIGAVWACPTCSQQYVIEDDQRDGLIFVHLPRERWLSPAAALDQPEEEQSWNEQKFIDIVFDGPPGPESGRFVEIERDGASISVGEWVQQGDLWILRIPDYEAELAHLRVVMRKSLLCLETSICHHCGKLKLGETDAADVLRAALD